MNVRLDKIICVGDSLTVKGGDAAAFPNMDAVLAKSTADADGVIVDLRSKRGIGLSDLRRLRSRFPRAVLFVVIDLETPTALRLDATKAGCDQLLPVGKDITAAEIVNRARAILDSGVARPRILVVDDAANNRELLRQELDDVNFEVLLAEDGFSALTQVRNSDLVVLDLLMPGMNGREVCQKIRSYASDQRVRSIPIIMLSAMSEIKDKLAALDMGANDYVTKPVEIEPLVEKIRLLLWLNTAQGTKQEKAKSK